MGKVLCIKHLFRWIHKIWGTIRRIHHKVTESHLHPNIAEKMKNELAETMLNTDMLHLMKSYRDSLSNGKVLDGAVELLEKTTFSTVSIL
jgi:hypothetical protein